MAASKTSRTDPTSMDTIVNGLKLLVAISAIITMIASGAIQGALRLVKTVQRRKVQIGTVSTADNDTITMQQGLHYSRIWAKKRIIASLAVAAQIGFIAVPTQHVASIYCDNHFM